MSIIPTHPIGRGMGQAAADARYAPIAKGVTNGDSHDHSGGDGGTIAYGSLSGTPTIPVKATGAEINTGTDDAKFATAKAIADSDVAFLSDIPSVPVKATGTEINTGTNDTKFATPKAIADSDIAFLSDIPSVPVSSVFGRTGTVTATTNDYTWAQINKGTSDVADITTRNIRAMVWNTATTATNLSVVAEDFITVTGTADITLPMPSATYRPITVKRTIGGVNTIRVTPNASETIDGASSKSLTTQYAFITVISDGTNWHIIASGGTIS